MPHNRPKKKARIQCVPALEKSAVQGDMDAKRELAGRLLKGDGMNKDKEKAVSLLEDCVACGDTDAMVMLAKCCALGRGMERNAERAEALLSDAAEKGNNEARILMRLIDDWKGKESINLRGLQSTYSMSSNVKLMSMSFIADKLSEEWTIESVTLVMNVVPCRSLNLMSQA